MKDLHATRRVLEGDAVVLQRTYDTTIDDMWDAITNTDRIPRWFAPVTGDLRLGGTFQVEGNAGGEILACEPPHRFRISWVFGDDASEVEVRLSASDGGRTTLELTHSGVTKAANWAEFGPGAVGVGWDLSLLGLGLYLGGGTKPADPMKWMASPEGKAFMTTSSQLWGEAYRASGADNADAAAKVANTTKAYTGG